MTVEHRTGDLFLQGLNALGHGVNCQGYMGAGIARKFRYRWPDMYTQYQQRCQARLLRPGGLFTWVSPRGFVVYNLASQLEPGPCATLPAIRSSMAAAIAHAETNDVDAFGIPRLGAGLGGLDWHEVEPVIHEVADASSVTVVVVTLPS